MIPPPISFFFPDPGPEPGQREVRFGGPPVDNVAIDEEGSVTLLRLVSLCAVLGLGLAYLCFRSLRITFMIFFVGGVAAVMSLGIVWWLGSAPDAVLMTMPALVYVLGLSGSIHIVNYYREQVQEHGRTGAAEVAVGHGWFPCTLAAFTTALGMASLCTSSIVPIWKFGLFSAIGTMATVTLLFTYLPAALHVWAPRWKQLPPPDQREGAKAAGGFFSRAVGRFWMGLGNIVIRHHWPVLIGCLILLAIFGYGATRIKTSVQLLKLFDQNSKIIRDYTWLEKHLGELTPIELVVKVPQDMQQPPLETLAALEEEGEDRDIAGELQEFDFLERLEIPDRIQRAAYEAFGPASGRPIMGPGLSAATFGPVLPGPDPGLMSARGPMRSLLEENRRQILETDYLRIEEGTGTELWRISLRVAAMADVDYGMFVRKLETIVEPILWAYTARNQILHALLLPDELTAEEAEIIAPGEDNAADAGDPPPPDLSQTKILLLGINPRTLAPLPEIGDQLLDQTDAELRDRAGTPETTDTDENPGWSLARWWDFESLFASASNSGKNATADEQARLFALTLDDLLRNRGFRTGGRRISQKVEWHDPVAQPITDDPETQQNWRNYIAGFDMIVLVRDAPEVGSDGTPVPDYEMDVLRDSGAELLDARGFLHRPDGDEPTPTAAERIEAGDSMTRISVIYTGVVPIVYKAQRTLLSSLIESIAQAFVMIAFVMMILLRNWQKPFGPWNIINVTGGLLSMLPNMFPVVVVFGGMALMGISVDIGTMMTASVALGIAVDDTIHFLNWYRMGLRLGLSRADAIRMSYHHVATAMTQTTLVGGLGMSVFAFSTFTPTQRFGILMLTLLAVALIGDMIFLPALLASPLGRFFGKSATPEEAAANREQIDDLTVEVAAEVDPAAADPTAGTVPPADGAASKSDDPPETDGAAESSPANSPRRVHENGPSSPGSDTPPRPHTADLPDRTGSDSP